MINVLLEKGKAFIEKRKVKSRGIALTHEDQGYSANLRPISLLTKSDIDPQTITVDMLKTLEQVNLTISMEEFLRRFFNMWSDDAELLTKILGFTTQFEQNAEENEDDMDNWEVEWNKRHQEYLDDKVSGIQLLKSAQEGKELSLIDQYSVFQIRKQFEEGAATEGVVFSGTPDAPKPNIPVVPEPVVTTPVVAPVPEVPPTPQAPSLEQDINKTKEPPVENTEVDVTKSAKFLEVVKRMEAMEADNLAAKEIIKAHEDARREVMLNKASGMAFVAEDQRADVVTLLLKSENSLITSLLEKAQSLLAEKDALLTAKDTEIEDVKKTFANGKEIGVAGDLSKSATGELTAQERLNEIVKSRAAELAAK